MTGFQPINHDQAKALARLLHHLRSDWDEPGIMTAIGQARTKASPADLAVASIRASQRAANRTPAVIALDGEHWRPVATTTQTYRPPRRDEMCPAHGDHIDGCRGCAADDLAGEPAPQGQHHDTDQGARATRWAARIRADLTDAHVAATEESA